MEKLTPQRARWPAASESNGSGVDETATSKGDDIPQLHNVGESECIIVGDIVLAVAVARDKSIHLAVGRTSETGDATERECKAAARDRRDEYEQEQRARRRELLQRPGKPKVREG